MKKSVAAVLMASLVLAALPVCAEPALPAFPKPATAVGGPLTASIDRAVAKATADPRVVGTRDGKIRATQGAGMATSGGGGGTGKYIVMMLVTTAISVGTYYFIIKKTQDQIGKPTGLRY